ncbi:MAG: hypothetical protein RBT34_00180 [Anaerolineaceae bacterium]|jgi:hypothetical protein|nr:hypothetical protein [Anaerolineaceae bacterium]
MATIAIYVDTADMATETGMSNTACQLLATLQPPCIEESDVDADAVTELLENGFLVKTENSITLSKEGLELIQDFQ